MLLIVPSPGLSSRRLSDDMDDRSAHRLLVRPAWRETDPTSGQRVSAGTTGHRCTETSSGLSSFSQTSSKRGI